MFLYDHKELVRFTWKKDEKKWNLVTILIHSLKEQNRFLLYMNVPMQCLVTDTPNENFVQL
jgi:hypothetical protein